MIELASNYLCTGCGCCENICPQKAIFFVPDEEGFLQPRIKTDVCTGCGLCMSKCPVLNPFELVTTNQKAYAVISNDDRKKSSSGGAFSVFARYVIQKGGVVYGATMNDQLQVSHIKVSCIDELDKLRGSKYVQSKIGTTYLDAKQDLKSGKIVLFSGTPCQIAGLYKYLGNKYEKQLITLDLVCHGVPNQLFFDSYIYKLKQSKFLKISNQDVIGYRFRKLDSWSIVPTVKFAESQWQVLEQEDNAFMSSFFRRLTFRECCYKCQYSQKNRIGTYTLADYWGIGKNGQKFNKNVSAGVSLVLYNGGIATDIIAELQDLAYIEERPLEEGRKYNHNLSVPSIRPDERNTAIKDMLDDNITLGNYAKKYNLLENKWKHLAKKTIKDLIYRLGIYNVYKSLSYKISGK